MSSNPASKVRNARFSPVDLYLILYNSLCVLGWAYVVTLAIPTFVATLLDRSSSSSSALSSLHRAARAVYRATPRSARLSHDATPTLAAVLTVVQSAALLEVLHAGIGWVRSPLLVTAVQVASRLVALLAINGSVAAQNHWAAALMILSWSLVEVPRYLFYLTAIITGDSTKKTPYLLFWLRYSLFLILYPTGISGELMVLLSASNDQQFLSWCLGGEKYQTLVYASIMTIVAMYVPGTLPMIFNMVINRKHAFKKRFAKPPPPPRGLVWPVTSAMGDKEERSSTITAKQILASALSAVDPQLASCVINEKKWRFGYQKHLEAMVQAQCISPQDALKIAQAGLDQAYQSFQFVSKDGLNVTSFAEAMSLSSSSTAVSNEKFHTGFVQGTLAHDAGKKLQVMYNGKALSGVELKNQVKKWVDYGTIEPSAGDAILRCIDNPSWIIDLNNNKKRYFVLLGAGSAMGPFEVLMSLGANVIAIDLDRPFIWKRLMERARNSSGSLTFPMSKDSNACAGLEEMYAVSGCNLFTQTPMIRDWLLQLYPGASFTVGSYAYLNGALHVQVSLAMDAICRDLCDRRDNTSLAYLCTPTDLHLIPKEAHDAAERNHEDFSKRLYCKLVKLFLGKRVLRRNVKKPVQGVGGDYYYVNGISVAQGPNYALAKRMQHWRAIIARSKGCIVSSNIAPSTSTASVTQNRTFAWAYEGMPYFTPYEIFAPETSNSVMSALLIHDLNNDKSVANPKVELSNPNQLFSFGAFHGGTWRCAYEIDSIGEASVLLYFVRVATPYVVVLGGLGLAVGGKYFGFI